MAYNTAHNGCMRALAEASLGWVLRDEWVCECTYDKRFDVLAGRELILCHNPPFTFFIPLSHILWLDVPRSDWLFPIFCLVSPLHFLLYICYIPFSHCLFLLSLHLLTVLWNDIYSNSLTGHSGGRRCKYPSEEISVGFTFFTRLACHVGNFKYI